MGTQAYTYTYIYIYICIYVHIHIYIDTGFNQKYAKYGSFVDSSFII